MRMITVINCLLCQADKQWFALFHQCAFRRFWHTFYVLKYHDTVHNKLKSNGTDICGKQIHWIGFNLLCTKWLAITDNNHLRVSATSLQRDVENPDLFCMSLSASRANMAILARNKARMWTTSGKVLRMLRNALRS